MERGEKQGGALLLGKYQKEEYNIYVHDMYDVVIFCCVLNVFSIYIIWPP